jgi:apolipoprotein N-acyltransferase
MRDAATIRPDSAAATRLSARPLAPAAAVAAAAASGCALLLAFPPYDVWWLAPVAVAMLAIAVHRRKPLPGAGVGAVAGMVFFTPLLSWTNLEIGNAPWLLLSTLQALYLSLLAAGLALLSPAVDRWRWSWPLMVAAIWVAQEALRSRTPFGGFPWGRLAFSQTDSTLLPLAAWGGAPAVTFAVAVAGGLLAAAAWRRWSLPARHRGLPGGLWRPLGLAAAAGLVMVAGLAVPPTAPVGEAVTVAIVQGNVPRLGLDFNQQRRAVLDNHVNATLALADEVAAGRQPPPDLVIWPENSSDIDPVANADAGARIDEAATAINAPILVGAILRASDGSPRNVGLVWHPQQGPGQSYAKRHPVPFAEYLPWEPVVRPLARAIAGDPVDRIAGFTPGAEPGVLVMGPATIGNVICFEVAYDAIVRDTVVHGAELLVVQTNNATFNEAEARQQMAMVRLRAVEHGRWALMASTVGVSGFVDPSGQVHDATGFFTADVLVRNVTLASGRTTATTVAGWPEILISLAAAGAVMMTTVMVRRNARRDRDAVVRNGELHEM